MDVGLVCDECSAFNEWGATTCVGCQQGLSLGDASATASAAPPPCVTCGAVLVDGNRFCGACGTPVVEETRTQASPSIAPEPVANPPASENLGKKTLFFSNMQAAKAKLVLIKGEGYDGESYALAGKDHRIGSSDADIIFDEDPFLSPTHANFYYESGKLVVEDEDSENGVYLRIRGSKSIGFEDRFLVGEQVIQVHRAPGNAEMKPRSDGTYIYSSPRTEAPFQLIQLLHGGSEGVSILPASGVATMGREQCDLNFPEDPFISGSHAQVAIDGDSLRLSDLGSKNGTFIQINQPTALEHGDYVFMGQQLLRVEIV